MILNKTRAKDLKGREERGKQQQDTLARPCPRAGPSLWALAWMVEGLWGPSSLERSREPRSSVVIQGARPAAGKAAEVLRKLADCICEVAPPGHKQISLEDVVSRRATAHAGPI